MFSTILVSIFLAIMLYVAFNVLRFGFGAWRQMKNFTRSAESQSGTSSQSKQHTKVFDKSDGEYVEFEEVTDNASTTQYDAADSADDSDVGNYPNEDRNGGDEQISDAKYEEID